MDAFSQNLRKIWTREAFIKIWNVIVRVIGVRDVWLARSGNVRVTTCQKSQRISRQSRTVKKLTKSQGNVKEVPGKNLVGENCLLL